MACFCSFLEEELSEIGLDLEFPKSEAVPAAGVQFTGARDRFRDFAWVDSGNFKLLGAPIGSAEFCEAHARKRVEKAGPLFKAIRNFHHVQGGLLLLRHCASFSKIAYSARTVPRTFIQWHCRSSPAR